MTTAFTTTTEGNRGMPTITYVLKVLHAGYHIKIPAGDQASNLSINPIPVTEH